MTGESGNYGGKWKWQRRVEMAEKSGNGMEERGMTEKGRNGMEERKWQFKVETGMMEGRNEGMTKRNEGMAWKEAQGEQE